MKEFKAGHYVNQGYYKSFQHMKLIKPSEISGEIMTLLEEADEKLILVSPYCRFSK